MTLGIGMYFSRVKGALITDRKGSYGDTHSVIFQKSFNLSDENGFQAYVVGAGNSALVDDVMDQIEDDVEDSEDEILKPKHLVEVVTKTANISRAGFIDRFFKTQYGLDVESAIKKGFFGPNSEVSRMFDVDFLVFVREEGCLGLYIYGSSLGSYFPVKTTPYKIIGSGVEIAMGVLDDFVLENDWKVGVDINPLNCLQSMLKAYNLTERRQDSVGGVPNITLFDNDKIIEVGSNNGQLARVLVELFEKKLIHSNFLKKNLEGLLFKNYDVDVVLENLLDSSNKKTKINILRMLSKLRLK